MDFEEIIRNRESVRKFSHQKIEMESIKKILEAGRLAPTAKNAQPVKIYVLDSKEAREKLDKATTFRYGAQTSFLICGNKEEAWVNEREEYPTAEVDCAIITTHMMLEATNLGIDSIWIRFFNSTILKEEFDIPDNLTPVALLNIGYRESDYKSNPLHQKRKSLEEMVEFR